jgi:hypothetical protein
MTEQSATLSLPRAPRIGGFLLVLGTWLSAAWLVVGTLVAPAVPGHWLTVLAAAVLLTALPIAAFVRSRRAGHYPGALFRIVVLRTFWYAQLLLIVLAIA